MTRSRGLRAFPPHPLNDGEGCWFCPGFGQVVDDGLCWECSMADQGGPTDTAEELRLWVKRSGRFGSIGEFQEICAKCIHCPWREPTKDDSGYN